MILSSPMAELRAGNLVFPDALVAHWPLNETAGMAARDTSTNGFDGTLVSATWTNGPVLYDGALAFNGVNDAVYFPACDVAPPALFESLACGSISVRFQFRATGAGEIIPLFYYGEAHTNTTHNSLILEIGHQADPANRKLFFTIVNARFCFDSGTNLLPNTWYHFVGVVGTNGNTGYLNGEEMTWRHYNLGATPTNSNFFASVPVRECMALGYGRYGMMDEFFHGPCVISDLQLYNRPLTPTEVQQLCADLNDTGVLKCTCRPGPDHRSLALSWASETNYVYNILQAGSPNATYWEPLMNCQGMAATPPMNTINLPMDLPSAGFYRVEAVLLGR